MVDKCSIILRLFLYFKVWWAMEFGYPAKCSTSITAQWCGPWSSGILLNVRRVFHHNIITLILLLYGKVGFGDTKCSTSVPLHCTCSHTSWCGGPRSSWILRRVFHYNNIILLIQRVITLALLLHGHWCGGRRSSGILIKLMLDECSGILLMFDDCSIILITLVLLLHGCWGYCSIFKEC